MKTESSLSRSPGGDCCSSVPPLSPLAYISFLFLPYISMVVGNAVTLRQMTYAKEFEDKYGHPLEPLPDTSILQNVELPSFTSRLAMRDWVNVLSALWCVVMFLLWLVKRNYVSFTTFLATETYIVPIFALSQWLTVVPDSDPECLSTIPNLSLDGDWIWTRLSLVQCGDTIWSSALVQVILFSVLGFSGFESKCIQGMGILLSNVMVFIISVVAWMALYQYGMDIVLSIFVTSIAATHPFMRFMGKVLYYTEWDTDTVRYSENVGLMSDEYEEEFSLPQDEV